METFMNLMKDVKKNNTEINGLNFSNSTGDYTGVACLQPMAENIIDLNKE